MASSAQYYTPAKTDDDDDEEEEHLTSSLTGTAGRRPPPPTQYRDDPSNSYRDNPTPTTANKSNNDEENVSSIFDWGAPSSTSAATETAGSGGKSKKKKNNNHKGTAFQMDDPTTFDPDVEIPFTPISLHDDDEDSESDVSGAEQLRPHVNGLFKSTINRRSGGGGKRSHNGNLYGQIDNGGDDDEHQQQEGRLFVGGGWGRHGSTTDYRCGKLLTNCCSCERRYCCGRNPHGNNNFLCSSTGCFVVVFVMMTFLCGYLGYEAGLPVVTTTLDTANTTATNDDGFETTEHSSHTSVTTHGDLWLEWIKKEKDEIHLPHFHLNFTKRHAPIIYTDDNNNKQLSFPPMSQSELLTQSQHVFQSCSERSIATAAGRDACLSFCHGLPTMKWCAVDKLMKIK